MRPYHVAIVGSGPSGYFAAASLLKFADSDDDADVRGDMIEMLPTPWGLVRSGVAPDHPKIKSISAQFDKIAQDPRFRFFGNVTVGGHVPHPQPPRRQDRRAPARPLRRQRRRRRARPHRTPRTALRGGHLGGGSSSGRTCSPTV